MNDWLCQHPEITGHPETYFLTYLIEAFQSLRKKGWDTSLNDKLLRRTFWNAFTGHGDIVLIHDNNLIAHASELDRIFPTAHYLVFHRDGRRVAASLKNRVPQMRGRQLTKRWLRQMRMILDGKLPRNCLIMRYDEIGASSKRITEFIGIEHHGNIDTRKEVNCSFEGLRDENFWRDFLTEEDQEHFAELADILREAKYQG